MAKIRILHLVYSIGPHVFGPPTTAACLVKESLRQGVDAALWCTGTSENAMWALNNYDLPEDALRVFPTIGFRRLAFSPQMFSAASGVLGNGFNILHQHSLWTAVSLGTNRWRRRFRRPTVISPHGCLQTWALSRASWKKRLVSWLYERENLKSATCLAAVAEAEINDFKAYGLCQPTAVLPTAIPEAWLNAKTEPEHFRNRYRIPRDKRILLFLSRIHPKKGLPMLIEAISGLRDVFRDWILVVAGREECGHQAELQRTVDHLGLDGKIVFVGPQYGADKRNAYAAADVFVLPSFGEGAPAVIVEALGAGVPVIATKGSPWPELETERCGWWTEINSSSLQEAIGRALALPPEERAEMGERGRSLVERKYTWSKVAKIAISLYERLLHHGSNSTSVVDSGNAIYKV